ncbi:MAG: tetratricopeptide repeat protein [Acidobacteria bacterium]|nr:tetratricopeptide repeat protein [Acidobacteriota bacterium]
MFERRSSLSALQLGVAALLLSLAFATPAYAQRDGVISGRVTDVDGSPLAGAMVSVYSPDRGDTRSLTADEGGNFMGRGFRTDVYVITISADGYQPVQQELKVDFGQNTVDASLVAAVAPSNVSYDDINALYQAGFDAYERQDWAATAEAMAPLLEAVDGLEGEEADVMRASAMEALGRAQFETGELDAAIATYEGLLEDDPDSLAGHHWKAQAHARQQDFPSALPHARRAAELAPNDMAMQYNAAVILLQTDDVEGGIAALERAVEINPEFPLGRKQLGYAYLRLGAQDQSYYAKAIEQLRAYIEQSPDADDRAEVEGMIGALEAQIQG